MSQLMPMSEVVREFGIVHNGNMTNAEEFDLRNVATEYQSLTNQLRDLMTPENRRNGIQTHAMEILRKYRLLVELGAQQFTPTGKAQFEKKMAEIWLHQDAFDARFVHTIEERFEYRSRGTHLHVSRRRERETRSPFRRFVLWFARRRRV